MRINLGMCSIQRPLDDKSQLCVRLEAEAVLGIITFCEAGRAELLSSDALEFENGRNPHPTRKAHAAVILEGASRTVRLSNDIERPSREMVNAGIKPLDALYLACAVEADADYFCTCDDRLLKRARATHAGFTKVIGPLELVAELGL